MAIRGAFSAGLVKGFATSLQDGIKDRQARMDELISNQMDTVKRSAPKLAQSMAEAKNAQMIMGEMKTQFGVTEEEFIALAQNYDINAVYGAVQKAQSALPEGSKLDKSQFLGSLNIPKGVALPEGMTAEQAIESIYLGYARNVNEKPGDKSETHKNRSWGKALKDTLMLDPRASAEEQLQAMSYMGMPVNEIVQYEASQGSGYKPMQGVERVQGFDIKTTDYAEKDYMSTASTYERTFTRTFAGTDDLANVTDMQGALDAIGAPDKASLGNKLRKGGTAIADLELGLSESGMQSTLERDRTLLRLSNEVNTAEEMDNLIAAVNDGTALELIQESMQKSGRLTDDYIEYILTGVKPEEEVDPTVASVEPDAAAKQTNMVLEETVVEEEVDPTVAAILNNAATTPEEVQKKQHTSRNAARRKAARAARAKAGKVKEGDGKDAAILNNAATTPEEVEEKPYADTVWLTIKAARDVLPKGPERIRLSNLMNRINRKTTSEQDAAEIFAEANLSSDEMVSAAEPEVAADTPTEAAPPKAPENINDVVIDYGQDIITGLMDAGITAEDGPEEFKLALVDWFGENEGQLGGFTLAGSSVSIDMLTDVFKRTFDLLDEQ